MSQTYTIRQRIPQQDASAGPALSTPASAGNQAMAALLLGGDTSSLESTLDQRMQERFQRFAQHQIPRAEQEADQIASGVQTAHTPEEVKTELGDQMGADFSDVRFHTGADAENRAASIGARAFTTGKDIYFGAGGFEPSTAAHELVHTVQQGVVSSSMDTVSAPAGGVQMIEWSNVKRPFKRIGAAVKEFVGGKLGLLDPSKKERKEAARRARKGDYSQSARMSKKDAEALVAERKARIQTDFQAGQLAFDDESATAALDPFDRKAMSQMARDNKTDPALRKKLQETMEKMDLRMIENTLTVPTSGQRENLKAHYKNNEDQKRLAREYQMSRAGKTYLGGEEKGTDLTPEEFRERAITAARGPQRTDTDTDRLVDESLARSKASGDVLLRTMLLMQMGDFQRTDANGTRREWDKTMANAFSHGARTGFIFDSTRDSEGKGMDLVTEQLFGENMGEAAGVHARAAATHHIITPKAGQKNGYKEENGISAELASLCDSSYGHFGMDMAIGGIGMAGTSGEGRQAQMINADGRSGHMYIGRKKSSDEQKGGLLMGLESDSPYRMNQTGHMHNAAATAEEGSSTGGLKTDLQGKKYGGRTVDLSGLSHEEVANVLQHFTNHINGLRSERADGETEDDAKKRQAKYDTIMRQIVGGRMTPEALKALLAPIMGEGVDLDALIRRARGATT